MIHPVITYFTLIPADAPTIAQLTTDVQTDMRLLWQTDPPAQAQRQKRLRGININCGWYYEWAPIACLLPAEPQPSFIHTFTLPLPLPGVAPSILPIFADSCQLPAPSGPPITLPTYPSCPSVTSQWIGADGAPWPTNNPPGYEWREWHTGTPIGAWGAAVIWDNLAANDPTPPPFAFEVAAIMPYCTQNYRLDLDFYNNGTEEYFDVIVLAQDNHTYTDLVLGQEDWDISQYVDDINVHEASGPSGGWPGDPNHVTFISLNGTLSCYLNGALVVTTFDAAPNPANTRLGFQVKVSLSEPTPDHSQYVGGWTITPL